MNVIRITNGEESEGVWNTNLISSEDESESEALISNHSRVKSRQEYDSDYEEAVRKGCCASSCLDAIEKDCFINFRIGIDTMRRRKEIRH